MFDCAAMFGNDRKHSLAQLLTDGTQAHDAHGTYIFILRRFFVFFSRANSMLL